MYAPHRTELPTWHRILIVVLKPAEQTVDCREYLGPIPKAFRCDGYIFYSTKRNTKAKIT